MGCHSRGNFIDFFPVADHLEQFEGVSFFGKQIILTDG